MNSYIDHNGNQVIEVIKEVKVNEDSKTARVLVYGTTFEGLVSNTVGYYAYVPVLIVK